MSTRCTTVHERMRIEVAGRKLPGVWSDLQWHSNKSGPRTVDLGSGYRGYTMILRPLVFLRWGKQHPGVGVKMTAAVRIYVIAGRQDWGGL